MLQQDPDRRSPEVDLDIDKAIVLSAIAARSWADASKRRDGTGILQHLVTAAAWVGRARRHQQLPSLRLDELVEAFSVPVDEWLPGGPAGVLIDSGEATPLCAEFADEAGANALAEVEQRVIVRAMHNLGSAVDAGARYTTFRRFLVEHAHATVPDAAGALMTVRLELSEVYGQIQGGALVDTARGPCFYACPRCGWPMRVRDTQVSCAQSETCLAAGARFRRQPQSDELLVLGPLGSPRPTDARGVAALLPGVWRYTVLPGLEELELYRRLTALDGVDVVLWPNVDQYDLQVRRGDRGWNVDVKDHASPYRLGQKLIDRPPPRETWIVVPDRRRHQVEMLRRMVPSDAGYRFASSTEFVRRVQEVA